MLVMDGITKTVRWEQGLSPQGLPQIPLFK